MSLPVFPKKQILLIALLLLSTSLAASSKAIPQHHEKCLEARDYAGCMRVQTGTRVSTPESADQQCEPYKMCTATAGIDPLGRAKIVGWKMTYYPSERGVHYVRPSFKKVNVRGETNRYVEFERLVRIIEDPKPAIAPTTTTIGSAQTNCTGYGSMINCSTTPATTITLPGRAGSTGGIREFSYITVVDCKDKTAGMHSMNRNGKLLGKWIKVEPRTHFRALEDACPIIDSLELSSFDKYAQ